MKRPRPLTELQLELLGILWERGEASTAEVCEALAAERAGAAPRFAFLRYAS